MNKNELIWQKATLRGDATIEQAIRNLDQVAIKIVLVVNDLGILLGTLSDGDIRRALLKGKSLESRIVDIINPNPLVVTSDISSSMVKQLMLANKMHQIPIVDEANIVIGLHLWDSVPTKIIRPNTMVIMAGGAGIRLRPHTENCPKPLLSVAGRPILEHIIERAKLEGFINFVIAIHYLGHMIVDCLGDGERLQVKIDYLEENSPLGTAGALGLFKQLPDKPFLVTNGDVITDIRYGELLDFHVHQAAMATMAVRKHEWQNPFGVVKTQGVDLIGFEEKPILSSYINAGVYVLNPDALNFLNIDSYCDMPTLFERLRANSSRTIVYPMHEPWLDIGRPEDLASAKLIRSQ